MTLVIFVAAAAAVVVIVVLAVAALILVAALEVRNSIKVHPSCYLFSLAKHVSDWHGSYTHTCLKVPRFIRT